MLTSAQILKIEKSCSDIRKKSPDCVYLWVTCLIWNAVLKASRRKNSKIFPCRAFLWCVVDKMFIEVLSIQEISSTLKNSWLRAWLMFRFQEKTSCECFLFYFHQILYYLEKLLSVVSWNFLPYYGQQKCTNDLWAHFLHCWNCVTQNESGWSMFFRRQLKRTLSLPMNTL